MSHIDPTRTYEEDILALWPEDELQRLYELYTLDCARSHTTPTMSDFLIYLEELI